MPVAITEITSIDDDVHGAGPAWLLIGGLGFGRWAWFRQIPAFLFIERYADVNREVVAFLKPRESRERRGTPREQARPLGRASRAVRRLIEGARARVS